MKSFIFIFAFYCCTNIARCDYGFFENRFPFERSIIYPFQMHAAVQFESKDAKPIQVPPMRINIHPNSQLLVNKTRGTEGRLRGYSLDDATAVSLTGGVVFNDEYVLYVLGYLVDGVPSGHVGGIIDGESSPLKFLLLFRKKSYTNFLDATRHADGFLAITIPILVEENDQDNLDFANMENILYQMRSPNASAIYVPTEEAIGWLLRYMTRVNAFYSFPHTVEQSVEPGPIRQSAIRLIPAIPRNQYLSISKRQFDQFSRVLKENGKPLTFVVSTFPLGERPLVKAYTRVLVTKNYQ